MTRAQKNAGNGWVAVYQNTHAMVTASVTATIATDARNERVRMASIIGVRVRFAKGQHDGVT